MVVVLLVNFFVDLMMMVGCCLECICVVFVILWDGVLVVLCWIVDFNYGFISRVTARCISFMMFLLVWCSRLVVLFIGLELMIRVMLGGVCDGC